MALTNWTVRLDDDFLRRVERQAEEFGTTAENLVVEYLHRWSKRVKRRHLREEAVRTLEERPTLSLEGQIPLNPGSVEEADKKS